MKKLFLRPLYAILGLSCWLPGLVIGQTFGYEPVVQPLNTPELPGLQSFVWAQSQGQWLLIGGRRDGLHQRQPNQSFQAPGKNDSLFAINPITWEVAAAPTSDLPEPLRSQFESTNAEFWQDGDYLIIAGGYGIENTTGQHITHPLLSVVNVPAMVQAIEQGTPIAPHVRYIQDTLFAVAGGVMAKLGDVFYLVGGHRFDGRYNPMGPTHGPGFSQRYISAALRFEVDPTLPTLTVQWLSPFSDPVNLHRRDYNLMPQIGPGGQPYLWAFAGVFQPNQDLPLLNTLVIDTAGVAEIQGFTHYLAHYHCAKVALYNPADATMHNLFFGGISQFEVGPTGTLMQNDSVPFVRTISRVSRTGVSTPQEFAFQTQMPELLGAGAEFIPDASLNAVGGLPIINLEDLAAGSGPADTLWLGHLVGGIHSTAPNIFFTNTGLESWASPVAYRVGLRKVTVGHTPQQVRASNPLTVSLTPNPARTRVTMTVTGAPAGSYHWQIHTANGVLVRQAEGYTPAGRDLKTDIDVTAWQPGLYIYTIYAGTYHRSVRFEVRAN